MEKTALPTPSREEQDYAALAHGSQIFCGFLGPLILFLWKRNSRFVSFHALQAVFWQLLLAAAALVTAGLVIAFVTFGLSTQAGGDQQSAPATFFVVPIFWLFILGGSILSLVLAIVYAIKAMRGQWAEYPIVGRWAKRVVGV